MPQPEFQCPLCDHVERFPHPLTASDAGKVGPYYRCGKCARLIGVVFSSADLETACLVPEPSQDRVSRWYDVFCPWRWQIAPVFPDR